MFSEDGESSSVDCLLKNNNFIQVTNIRNKQIPSKNIQSQYNQYIQLFGSKNKNKEVTYRAISPSLLKSRVYYIKDLSLKTQFPYLHEIEPALLKNSTQILNFMQNYDPQPLFTNYTQNKNNIHNKKAFAVNESQSNLLNMKLGQQMSLSDIQKLMIKQLDLSQIIKKQYLFEQTRININKKFILFLTGKYRALKSFNVINQSEILSSDVCKCVRDLMEQQQVSQEYNIQSRKNQVGNGAAGQPFTNPKIQNQSNQISINSDIGQFDESIKQFNQSISSDINDASLKIENEKNCLMVNKNYSQKKQIYQQIKNNDIIDYKYTNSFISQTGLQNVQSQSEKNSHLSDRMTNYTYNQNNQINNSYLDLEDSRITQNNSCIKQYNSSINQKKQYKNSTKDNKSKRSLKDQKINGKIMKNNEKNDLFSESSSVNTEQNNSIKEDLIKINLNKRKSDSIKLNEDSQDFQSNLNEKYQETKEKRKQIFHNLSKYLMHLILELLSEDHIDQFDLIPGYKQVLLKVINLLKQSGKRNQLSQTFYFNHSHYNCLFLTITSDNINKLKNNQEFYNSHKNVFEDIDFDDMQSVLNVNIIKMVIGQLALMQLDYIIELIESEFDSNLFELNNIQSDCQAKINYVKSVSEGIKKLLLGNNLIRF